MNVSRMDANGGWLATPSALVQFLNHVGLAQDRSPAISKAATIQILVPRCLVLAFP